MTAMLTEIIGCIVGPELANEAEHFYVCKACGQAVDMRRLSDVFHHEESDHDRIGVAK